MPTERRYLFTSWTVASASAIPELPASVASPDWRIVSAAAHRRRHAAWYQRAHSADGRPWVWLGRDGNDDVVRFPGRAWCIMRGGSTDIGCAWRRELPDDARAQMLVNHILPLAAARAGRLVLHASVVRRPSGGAVAIVGAAGAGKSTLAAYLGTRGWSILSDDRLIADECRRAYPIAPLVRLAPEAARRLGFDVSLPPGHHKVRIRLDGNGASAFGSAPAVLEHIVILRRGTAAATLQRVAGPDLVMEMLKAQLQLGIDRRDVRARSFAMLADVAVRVPGRVLTVPGNWYSLAEASALLDDLG